MGSTFAEHRVRAYVDIYGESKALALSLMGDIKDIVDGRIVFSITYKKGRTEHTANIVYLYNPTKTTLKNAFLGQKLRIIGRLSGATNSTVNIAAEYIEPILKEATK